jgi:4-amino-4-deoxychorismate lyase
MTLQVLSILGRGVVEETTPVALADDAGITRGDGCFEGLRLHRGPDREAVIQDLAEHLDRLGRSAAGLGIPFDRQAWAGVAEDLRVGWAGRFAAEAEAAVKFVLTRGRPGEDRPTGYATASSLPDGTLEARAAGIDVVTLPRGYDATAFAGAPWLLGGVKTLSYAVNMAAQREAARRGAGDALFVSADGQLLEAPTSSVVWAAKGTLHSVADGDNGILASITTRLLLDRAAEADLKSSWGSGTVADLHAADAVLLVGSVRGPVRVRSLDGVALPVSDAGQAIVERCTALAGFA